MVATCAGGNNGGYAKKVFVQAQYAIPLPSADVCPPEFIGPLMCGGITAYKPLVTHAKPGDTVGVVGLGGIGCMAVQFAVAYGCNVTVFSRGEEKKAQAMELGASKYVATSDAA